MKSIIISGGANGLGLELSKQLSEIGYQINIIDWDAKELDNVKNLLKDKCNIFLGDVSDEKFVSDTISKINEHGEIYALINNAGEPSFKLPIDYIKEDINKCFKGLEGMILLSSNVLKIKKEKDLKIINIISSAGLRGNKQESVYCATKWGERGYTESLKVAYKGTTVKIVGVYPGGIDTDFYKNSREYVSLEKQKTFMNPVDTAKIIINNAFNDINLTVSDIVIERNV